MSRVLTPPLVTPLRSNWMNMSDAATGQILWQDDSWCALS